MLLLGRPTRAILLLTLLAAGCATTSKKKGAVTESESSVSQTLANFTAPVRRAWRRVTTTEEQIEIPRWNWETALPQDGTRSELLAPRLPATAVAHFVPEHRDDSVRLVSTHPVRSLRITNVGGKQVRNCADVFASLEAAVEEDKKVQVDLIPDGKADNARTLAYEVTPNTLSSLCQTIAEHVSVARIADDGTPWLLIRQGGTRCKLTARVERERGLLNVVISTASCWGQPTLLPVDMRATCNGEPLRCLTVAETLERLYGDTDEPVERSEGNAFSFASVSERQDYLIPVNYKQLQADTDEKYGKTIELPPQPAFAAVPGEPYPGPAVLGDARALTGFMLQRQMCHPGDRERTGWVIFAGESLQNGGVIEVDVDLGRGPQRFRFAVPRS